jgi:hypothetical protein
MASFKAAALLDQTEHDLLGFFDRLVCFWANCYQENRGLRVITVDADLEVLVFHDFSRLLSVHDFELAEFQFDGFDDDGIQQIVEICEKGFAFVLGAST